MHLEITCSDEIEKLRAHYSRFFRIHYDGWEDAFDRNYDNHSKWFTDPEKTAYCRVTFKNTEGDLPVESAGFEIDTSCASICEINNFNYRDEHGERGVALIHSLVEWLSEINIKKLYCVVDRNYRDGKAYNLNTTEFYFVDTNQQMPFEGIEHRKNKRKVDWSLLVRELNT